MFHCGDDHLGRTLYLFESARFLAYLHVANIGDLPALRSALCFPFHRRPKSSIAARWVDPAFGFAIGWVRGRLFAVASVFLCPNQNYFYSNA
jgi:amino acid permease